MCFTYSYNQRVDYAACLLGAEGTGIQQGETCYDPRVCIPREDYFPYILLVLLSIFIAHMFALLITTKCEASETSGCKEVNVIMMLVY